MIRLGRRFARIARVHGGARMFWRRKSSPLEKEEEEWIISCWEWLLRRLNDLDAFRQFPLVLPTGDFFPPTKQTGHARARHIFRSVARLTGTEHWGYVLVPQEGDVNPVLGPMAVVQNTPSGPAGTFSIPDDASIRITYNPALILQPGELIATFAHEIAHALLHTVPFDAPGGPEFEEYATDVTVAFRGFGIFGANHAFHFSQFSDMATGTQGWSSQRAGYLTETQWGFCLAIFLYLRDEKPDVALKWLKPGPAATLQKSLRYFHANPDRLAALKRDRLAAIRPA
jgi:hypothetical protein